MRNVDLETMEILLEDRHVRAYGEHEFTVDPMISYRMPIRMIWPDHVYYHVNRDMFLPGELQMHESLPSLLKILELPEGSSLGLGTGELLSATEPESGARLFRIMPAESAKNLLIAAFYEKGGRVLEELPEDYALVTLCRTDTTRRNHNFQLAESYGAVLYILGRTATTEEFFQIVQTRDRIAVDLSEKNEVKYQKNKARYRDKIEHVITPKLKKMYPKHQIDYKEDFWGIRWKSPLKEDTWVCSYFAYNEEGLNLGKKYIQGVSSIHEAAHIIQAVNGMKE